MKIGSKAWWHEYILHRNQSSLQPVLEIVNNTPDELFLYVVRKGPSHYPPQEEVSDEKYLKDCFIGFDLFDRKSIQLEETVKLGNYEKKIDLVAQCSDEPHWVIEFKIVEEKRGLDERKMPINIEDMGAAIGQSLLYSKLYKDKYPSQKWNVMPAVCTWTLGGGSSQVIDLCKRLGVTVINLDTPDYVALYTKRQALKIYYLDDDNPRLFISDS